MNYTKLVISLVNGYAFDGGMELNLFFDVVISSENASFAVPEGLIGAIPPIASTIGVAMIGRRLARYCLTGDQMDAEEAKQLGIVDVIAPPDQLEIVSIEFADKISELAPPSAKAIKSSVNSVRDVLKNSLEVGTKEVMTLIPNEDFKEGMQAFVEKRKPK